MLCLHVLSVNAVTCLWIARGYDISRETVVLEAVAGMLV